MHLATASPKAEVTDPMLPTKLTLQDGISDDAFGILAYPSRAALPTLSPRCSYLMTDAADASSLHGPHDAEPKKPAVLTVLTDFRRASSLCFCLPVADALLHCTDGMSSKKLSILLHGRTGELNCQPETPKT